MGERPKGGRDPETPASDPGSGEELQAEASVPALEAEAVEAPEAAEDADLAEALALPVAEDAAEAYHARARLAEDRLAEVLGAYRKVKADNDAFRARMKRTMERQYEQRGERLLLKFIDVLDNFDRALEAAQTSYAGEPLVEGLILVRTQLLQTLKEQGLERVPALGLPYDPHVSEAVGTQPVQDPDHHHLVVKELLRGYRLNGKVARHSRVLIGECATMGDQAPPPAAADVAPLGSADAGGSDAAAAEASADEASSDEADVELPLGESELSLEEIIARAEAQDTPAPPDAPDAPSDAGGAPEPFALEEKPFERPATRPIVLADAEADSLASALAEEGWPEGLELPGIEDGPAADPKPKRGKR